MAQAEAITRPELTLPEAEAAHLRAAYERASVILEYGSGGSTALAAELPGKRVFSVESDRKWTRMMRNWLKQAPPAEGTVVDVIWSDVGPTKAWGYPVDDSHWTRYARYPLAVWDREDFVQPDVVLVDGRFRVGCAMAAALRSDRPVTVLFDDYVPRRRYHAIERFFGPPARTVGRMAEFHITPMTVEPGHLLTIIDMMTRP